MLSARLSVPLFTLLVLAGIGLRANADPVGDVLDVQGKWVASTGSAPVVRGESVSPGERLTADPSAGKGHIAVVLMDGSRLTATCAAVPCVATVEVPGDPLRPSPMFPKILATVKYVLLNEAPKLTAAYDSTSSRGLVGKREEMLVPYEAGRPLSLLPQFAGLTPGRYRLQLARLQSTDAIDSRTVQWNGDSGDVSVPMQEAGLYLLCARNRFGAEALEILIDVVPKESYETAKRGYEEAIGLCSTWPGSDAADSRRLFLRAYLIGAQEKP